MESESEPSGNKKPPLAKAVPEARTEVREKAKSRGSILYDGLLCAATALACVTVGSYLTQGRKDGTTELWIFAAAVSFAVSIPNLILMHSRLPSDYAVSAPLLATLWRGFAYVLILYVGTATKWLGDNFSVVCLQGCYFPFLVLESGLFIKRVRD